MSFGKVEDQRRLVGTLSFNLFKNYFGFKILCCQILGSELHGFLTYTLF